MRSLRIAAGSFGAASLAAGVCAAGWRMAERRGRRRIDWTPPGGTTRIVTLAVRSVGDAGPPVVLLHGLTGSGRYWGGRYDVLGDQARLVVPDLLGFGASPRPSARYDVEDHCDALAACLADSGIDEPAVVAGHSLGSLLAVALAARHPQLVRGVVGFAPPLFRTPADARRRVGGLGLTSRLFALPGPVARAACGWMCAHRDAAAKLARLWRPGLPAAIVRDGVQHSWVSYSETMGRIILAADAPAWLDDVCCPIALVIGDRDPIADRGLLDQLAAGGAQVAIGVWVGADHELPLTHPTECIAAILDMVTRTDPALTPTSPNPPRRPRGGRPLGGPHWR